MKFGIATAGNLTGCRGKRIRGAERAQRKVHKKRLEIPTSLLPPPIIQSTWVGDSKAEDRCCGMLYVPKC